MKRIELCFNVVRFLGSFINFQRSSILESIKWNSEKKQKKENNKLGSGSRDVKEYQGMGDKQIKGDGEC